MTFVRARRPRPFVRFNRADYERMLTGLREEITRQAAARRALSDWVASWLEQSAAAHDEDAKHAATPAERRVAHRMTADDLRQLAEDIERGPEQ